MESRMIADRVEDLASSLTRVASDPLMVRALHELLGDYCHQCRNTLNSLKLSLYLAKRDTPAGSSHIWSELEPRYQRVEQSFDRLQTICRPMSLAPIRVTLEMLFDERRPRWTEAMAARDRVLEFASPAEAIPGEFDPIRLTECLDALVLWRAEVGEPGQTATLEWGADPDRFELCWTEPSAWGFEPSDSVEEGPDALALPLLARVIAEHGGTFHLDLRDGLRLEAAWPRAGRSARRGGDEVPLEPRGARANR
jgi:hypothetical protein